MLTLTNTNYNATIVRVHNLLPLEGCDNVVGFPIFGYQAIVSKDTEIGSLGVLFCAEVQLSDEFCMQNNLYRHSEKNLDPSKAGYIEDSRRVKAVKFRGHRSSALFMPMRCLDYLGMDLNALKEGDSFNLIHDREICKKYLVYRKEYSGGTKGSTQQMFERIDNKQFPEHFDSENYFRNLDKYKDDDRVVITQKLHGTSVRFGLLPVKRQLNRRERFVQRCGIKVEEYEYDYVRGSRKVIKNGSVVAGSKESYYTNDVWKKACDQYKHLIPKNYIVYGELIGRDGDKPIQKNFTYQIADGTMELYVYRIAVVNTDGYMTDLSRDALVQFCEQTGLHHVPHVASCHHRDANVEQYMNKKLLSDGYSACLPLDHDSPCDEGVMVRVEGITPFLTKAKSPLFFEYETKLLDKGEVDMESTES